MLVRWAAAPALALAFWRCAGGAAVLGIAAGSRRPMPSQITNVAVWIIAAGIALGAHFATWLASLEMTSTAASVTIVSTAPMFVVGWHWVAGKPPGRRTAAGVLLATAGVAVLAGGDLLTDTDSLAGDGLALIGAGCMAVYLIVGARVRDAVPNAVYAPLVYGVAALAMAPVAVVSDRPLTGFGATTWLAIVAMVIGPQLGGHTTLNYLLGRIGSVPVSIALLGEAVAASALTWAIFGEVPPAAAAVGTPLVLIGLWLALRDGRPAANDP